MTDPYNIADVADVAEVPEAPRVAQSADDRKGSRRALLWLGLVVGAVCNVVTSSLDVTVFIGVGFGLLTLSCGAALVADHYRNRHR